MILNGPSRTVGLTVTPLPTPAAGPGPPARPRRAAGPAAAAAAGPGLAGNQRARRRRPGPGRHGGADLPYAQNGLGQTVTDSEAAGLAGPVAAAARGAAAKFKMCF